MTNALKETSSVPDKEVELSLSATEIKLCRMMKRVELLGEIRTPRGTNIDTEHAQQHRDHDGGVGRRQTFKATTYSAGHILTGHTEWLMHCQNVSGKLI